MTARQLRITLEYDGARFSGWQVQPGRRTVQGEVEAALATLLRHEVRVLVAGRTDAGVHARAQVCTVRTSSAIEVGVLRRGLDGVLPRDVAAIEVVEVPPDFHPRYDARAKHYRYRLLNRDARPVMLRNRCWHVRRPLDVEAMRAALSALEGRHDFSSFRASGCASRDPVKRIDAAELRRAPPLIDIDLVGSGFLKQMVRIIVGTVVDVGLGRRDAAEIPAVIAARDRSRAGRTAPAGGLTLMEVVYAEPAADPDDRGSSSGTTPPR